MCNWSVLPDRKEVRPGCAGLSQRVLSQAVVNQREGAAAAPDQGIDQTMPRDCRPGGLSSSS